MNADEIYYFCYLISMDIEDNSFMMTIYKDEEKLHCAIDLLEQIIKATPSYKEYNNAAKKLMCCKACLSELRKLTS